MDGLSALARKKILDENAVSKTNLARVLNVFDLTALGVSSTLGVGIYVLAGHIAKDIAGPAVVISFIIAAIASVLAGLCYAEFGARVPKAGSAYVYTYVCVGEFAAFIIGWNMILEYIIGSASVARSLSIYVDSLLNMTLQENFRNIAPIEVDFMSDYFDFFSFGLCFLFAVALGVGMKESSLINNICTIINLSVVLFVIIGGSTKANIKNWNLSPPNSHSNYGKGGFFPYGFTGMIQGAAVCFYGFIGFDCIATTGEEVKNPQKAIPVSIITSLFIIFLSYFGVSAVITLMIPYYLQSNDSPIPHAFALIHWDWAKWILTVGAVCGLVTSLFGSMFPLPRIIYAMAQDGLIFKFLGKVSERFHTPLIGTILSGILTGLMAALFKLDQLINMMSIATLLAYTIVSASVLLLRYSKSEAEIQTLVVPRKTSDVHEYTPISDNKIDIWYSPRAEPTIIREDNRIIIQLFNSNGLDTPTPKSEAIVTFLVSLYSVLSLALGLSITHMYEKLIQFHTWPINWIFALVVVMGIVLISISKQPSSKIPSSFKVPFVPLIPALSITVNIFLMLMLDSHTWIRLGFWMIIGFFIYGFYGFWNSILRYNQYERIE